MDNRTSATNPYEQDLDKVTANHTPLSPLSYIERAASVYPTQLAVVHGERRFTWSETFTRCRRLASALEKQGIGLGDTVAVLATNIPAFYECLFGVPACDAVINPINIRLDADAIAFILDHGEAKILITDTEFAPVVKEALAKCSVKPLVVDIADDDALCHDRLGEIEYEEFIAQGDPDYAWTLPEDEWQAIALCYTSGTTGNPKGVVTHHRGAYLNAIGNTLAWSLPQNPVYLWTLPMFHCCGWCFPWTIAIQGGTNVCLRRIAAADIYAAIEKHGVTYFCGAPIVLNFILNAGDDERRELKNPIHVMTAGAAPPAAILKSVADQGFKVTHAYGLTEVYGPAAFTAHQPAWDSLSPMELAEKRIRQGVRYNVLEDLDVLDPETMQPVPRDGETIGEIMFKGNVVMRGYLKNAKATKESLADGWFHSGDLAVMHPENYIQIKDRSKDIIISGGENISSIEVEEVLYKHPHVLEAAVVARPDEKWGESPCAFVYLKPSAPKITEEELIAYCRENIARFKAPKTVIFRELPKTSTGKIQKFKLRKEVEALGSL
ncbi:MAG: acyl-CoA synthetase [Gammaproteobacteria bacterium]|jgi:fatty-acyl-CoA synthase|nr:acyl-CoA synthetase [Gammaproteobacteria bacterium]